MTTPHIEHADLSEYVQMAISAKEDMELVSGQAAIWSADERVRTLESLADEAASAIDDVLSELRRIAGETTP